MKKKLIMVLVVLVLTGLFCSPVWGKGRTTRESLCERDWEKSSYGLEELKNVSKKVICKMSRGKLKHGRITKIDGFKVFYIKTYRDQKRFWKLLENRKYGDRYIEVSVGHVLNLRGDGRSENSTYIGYREDGIPIPTLYRPGSKVISTFVYSDVDKYTDSIVYRRDKVIK